MKTTINLPWWAVILFIAGLCLAVFLFTRMAYKTEQQLIKATEQRDVIEQQLQTDTDKRDSTLTGISKTSQSKAEQATKIIKNLPDEVNPIRDTTDAYMREYILNYSYE